MGNVLIRVVLYGTRLPGRISSVSSPIYVHKYRKIRKWFLLLCLIILLFFSSRCQLIFNPSSSLSAVIGNMAIVCRNTEQQ